MEFINFGCENKLNLMPDFKFLQHNIDVNGSLHVLFFTDVLFPNELKGNYLVLRELLNLQPSRTLKEGDARIIVSQLIEKFYDLPEIINLDNIIVHDQSKLKVWVINIANSVRREHMVALSIAQVIIELLIPRQQI